MNRRPLNSLPLGKSIIIYKAAEGSSDRSVDSYQRILEHWSEFAGNKSIAPFTEYDIISYLIYMRTEYVPRRWSGDTRTLSPKTLRNIWIKMCSFFRRANSEFCIENPMKNVPAPRFQKVEIEPFMREEVTRWQRLVSIPARRIRHTADSLLCIAQQPIEGVRQCDRQSDITGIKS